MAKKAWVVYHRDHDGRKKQSRNFTSKQAALIQARDLMQSDHKIHRIVGPHEVMDMAAVQEWMKANPE